ncbi:cTAGE family member 5 isoform X1 [Phycodurus eques]|uniref:cTAGE family member 5 isoform X1 n=1 Tax=Phycodurus eques TaxID=693459 RepID=UPI002ACDDFAF|nr:cTAGE family member 5 isoform X1 [Phycodurus eques]
MKKDGVTELMQEEEIEEFEDEKQEEFKEGEKQEEVEMLDEKNHEVDGESVEEMQKTASPLLDYLKWDMFKERDTLKNIEIDDKHGKQGDFTQTGEVNDFEDEKQEGFERRERCEVVDALVEKMQEVVEELKEEKLEEFKEREEEVGKLEEKKYEVSGESREELEDKGKEKFKDRELEELEKLEKYEVDVESIERFKKNMQEDFNDKEQQEVEKYEVDVESGEDLQGKDKMEEIKMKKWEEAGDFEELNEFESGNQEDLNKGINQNEVGEKRKGGVIKWKRKEETQEFNRDLKVSEDMQKVSQFVDQRNVKEELESLECMDELCTQIDQNEIITERVEHSFEDGSNFLYDASPLTHVLLADGTQENPKIVFEDIEHEFTGLTLDQTGKTEVTENAPHLDENGDGVPHKIFQRLYSVETNGETLMCDGCEGESRNNLQMTEFDEKSKVTTGSGGIFDPLKKVISSGQRPINKIKELTETPSGFAGQSTEMSKPQPLQTPEQELDSTTNNDKDVQTNLQPPSQSLTQNPQSTFLLWNTAKPLLYNYKTLQDHMGVEETTILAELLGEKKFKLLDYILGHPDVFTEDVDRDESILLEIETLLHDRSMGLSDAPEDDKDKTRSIIAIQKLEILLKRARDTSNTRKSDINRANTQAGPSCKDQETAGVMLGKRKDGGPQREENKEGGCEEMSLVSHSQTVPSELLEGIMAQIDVIRRIPEQLSSPTHATKDFLRWLTQQVVSSLPDDIRPGADLYGIPWEPIIFSSLLGLVMVLLFSCRCYSSVKSRMYRRKEWWMAEQVAQLLEEKCEVLETLSKCQQEYDELENLLSDRGASAETHKTRDLEVRAQQLDLAKTQLEENLQELKDQLDQHRAHRIEQEKKLTLLEQSMEAKEEETKELQSQEQQAQTTIKVYNMNTDRLQRNLETSAEENTLLKESNTQLRQQMEGWAERVSELEEEMRRYEMAHSGMVQDVANKDERIMSLTDRLLGMKAWDADLEGDGGDTSKEATGRAERNGKMDVTASEVHLQKVQKLIYAAKLNADLKSVDEDKDRVFAKLNDEVKAKEDLEVSIKELENEQLSMQADTEHYSEQVQRLQQKLQIMTEMYQENELKLHRLLTVEEKERLQKEDKLNKADKNIALAMEELNNYKLRAGEMEEELEKTKQSYQTQISAHEKKAHNNWLAARAADRALSDIKRENALLRQKLTDTQFKLDALDKDPFALDSLARPLPFRAERLPYGPSPLGRPASENRASLSPPTLLEGPLTRLSPRVTRGPVEPPTAQGELERSGGHSDSGSISPSWERDRRGPPGPFPPQGYTFPEPEGPVYRRPGAPPGPPFPHPRGLNSGPLGLIHPGDTTDGAHRENSLGPEQARREVLVIEGLPLNRL